MIKSAAPTTPKVEAICEIASINSLSTTDKIRLPDQEPGRYLANEGFGNCSVRHTLTPFRFPAPFFFQTNLIS